MIFMRTLHSTLVVPVAEDGYSMLRGPLSNAGLNRECTYNVAVSADVAKSLGGPVEPDSCALAALGARRALHLVAACMHVPALHAHMLEESGLLQPPSSPQMIAVRCSLGVLSDSYRGCFLQYWLRTSSECNVLRRLLKSLKQSIKRHRLHLGCNTILASTLKMPCIAQARLGAPLMQALQRLLAVLLSSAGGTDLLLHNPVAMGALLKALNSEADPCGPVFASESQPVRSAVF